MKRPIFLFLLALLSVSVAHARADVSLKNGNFFVTLRDVSFPGGLGMKIERVYNSKSDYYGMFGYSWGSEYEVRVTQDSDGTLLLTEFGGGASIRFIPKSGAKDLSEGVASIVEGAKKAGWLTNARSTVDYKARLESDPAYRAKQYGSLVNQGYLPKMPVSEGSQFMATQYQYQYLTKVKGGYLRVLENGDVQKFNEAGKLVQIMDTNKNYINFSYDKNNRLIQMVDGQNRKMNLTYNSFGYVEKVVGESGKWAQYRYDKDGFLSWSRDDAGVENSFKYSSDPYHNLIELGWPGQKNQKGQPKRMIISYYGKEKNTSVKSVVNPDGTSNEYEYPSDLNRKDFYSIRVLSKDPDGARISDSKYEYFYKKRAGGGEYTSRMVTTVDGEVTETDYDDRLGFPVKIKTGDKVTTMEYDQKGRMVKKKTPYEETGLDYDPKSGKVGKVTKKLRTGAVRWSEFQYDPISRNLLQARNSDKKLVKLVYDGQGRIRALMDESNRTLTFKYNEHSRPVEIADNKKGSVKFTYKNSGEVDKIDSNGGATVASDVMRTLQTLIDITAPAGVSMNL
jgi:YD repeat-containing protein